MGPIAWEKNSRCKYGDKRAFFAQLEIIYEDDSQDIIITDKSWHSDMWSPYTRCEIYHGADYDASLENDFELAGANNTANVEEKDLQGKLVAMQGVDVKQVDTIIPVDIFTTKKGETVVDMGQNMVGVVEINLTGRKGDEVELVHFEVLDKAGNVFTKNLRSARQGLNYTLKDGKNVFSPEMTFYGFRYIHVKKWPGTVTLDSIKGLVISSDMKQTGYLKTNDKLVNHLIKNTLWGQIGNYVDIPTDCPQRDERLGWSGDAHIFIKAAAYNYNVLPFFNKWLGDVGIAQRKDGSIPHVIPDVLDDNNCSSGWGDCCIIIPWQLYLRFGDIDILNKSYHMMENFMDYLATQGSVKHLRNKGFHFGDWLALDGGLNRGWGETPKDLIATAFYAHCANLMQKISKKLDLSKNAKKYEQLFADIKEAFKNEFITAAGRLSGHTQTAYTLALKFDLLNKNHKIRAIKELVNIIEDYGFITCGFIGSSYVLDVLSDNAHHELALKYAIKTTYPSWLYPVTMGATTIWEHWNSILPDGNINTREMNSFNHYAYGAICNWYYEYIAGIVPDEKNPGYKHFYLRPKPNNELNKIDAKLITHFGNIKMKYEMDNDDCDVTMMINIPDNTTAELTLDDCKAYMINLVRKKNSKEILLGPGKYDISYVKGGSVTSLGSLGKI